MPENDQRPDRTGKKTVVTYLPADVAKRLKILAVQIDRTMQDIGEEAIMDWLKNHEKTATKKK